MFGVQTHGPKKVRSDPKTSAKRYNNNNDNNEADKNSLFLRASFSAHHLVRTFLHHTKH